MSSLPDTDRDVALTTRHTAAGIKPEAILSQYGAEKRQLDDTPNSPIDSL